MWSLYGRLEPVDPALFAELLRLVQEDTGPADEDGNDEPSRRWDIDIRVEVEGLATELIDLRSDGTIELKILPAHCAPLDPGSRPPSPERQPAAPGRMAPTRREILSTIRPYTVYVDSRQYFGGS